MNDLLVRVQVQFRVVELDHDFRVTPVHCLVNCCVYLQIQHLNVPVHLYVFVQLGEKLCFTIAVVLWTPFIDFAQSDLVHRLLNCIISTIMSIIMKTENGFKQ